MNSCTHVSNFTSYRKLKKIDSPEPLLEAMKGEAVPQQSFASVDYLDCCSRPRELARHTPCRFDTSVQLFRTTTMKTVLATRTVMIPDKGTRPTQKQLELVV